MLINVIRALFVIVIIAVMFGSIGNITKNFPEDGPESMFPADVAQSIQNLIKTGEVGTSGAQQSAKIIKEFIAKQSYQEFQTAMFLGLAVVVMSILVDWLTPKKSLSILAGVFFGLLVGIFISWAMTSVLDMVNETYNLQMGNAALRMSKLIIGICICYLVISFVVRTKDDFRFVIPYVEFQKQTKGARPLVLDTSVIIDGRIADLCQTKLFDAPLIVPRFVLNELQMIADSADKLKRNRGRRGLDMLNKLQSNPLIEVSIDDKPIIPSEAASEVDQKLLVYTKGCDGRLVTNDYNLSKVALLRAVDVININDLANSLKPVVLPGEMMDVKIIKAGEEAQQGIGYLDDGTMVVVEEARDRIGEVITLSVTSSLQTSAGRMIFGKFERGSSSDSGSSQRRYVPMQRRPRRPETPDAVESA